MEDGLVDAAREVQVQLREGLLPGERVRATGSGAALRRVDRLVAHVHRRRLGAEAVDEVAQLEALGLRDVDLESRCGDLQGLPVRRLHAQPQPSVVRPLAQRDQVVLDVQVGQGLVVVVADPLTGQPLEVEAPPGWPW